MSGLKFDLSALQSGHAVQSNSVSGSFLQKSATMPKVCRDFRCGGPRKYQFRDLESLRLTQKARQRNGGLFSNIIEEISGDWTGWLGQRNSNRQIPFSKLAFEIAREFRIFLAGLRPRDFHATKLLEFTRTAALECPLSTHDRK